MEITIEKENGEPMSEKEAADLLRFIRRQLKPLIEVEEENCPFEPDNYSHDIKITQMKEDLNARMTANKFRLHFLITLFQILFRQSICQGIG